MSVLYVRSVTLVTDGLSVVLATKEERNRKGKNFNKVK